MKKIYFFRTLLFALLATMVSCTDEQEMVDFEDLQITMTATDFKYENNARTSYDITASGAEFKWAVNDTVGVFPTTGGQVYFPMVGGAGTNTASFDGGGWALKTSSSYAAYYPFIGDMYLDKTNIPVNFEGQTQVGNASTEHLGTYDYMVAIANTPQNGMVNFNFKHLGCLVELNLVVPVKGTISSVKLSADDQIFVKSGYVDITKNEPTIQPVQTSNTFVLGTDITTISEETPLKLYFMLAPIFTEKERLKVELKIGEETYIGNIDCKRMEAGKSYQYTIPAMTLDDRFLHSLQKAKDLLNGEIVLSTRLTMNGVDKTLLPVGCPTKFNFNWKSADTMVVNLVNFHFGVMPYEITFHCACNFMNLNSWEKDEYRSEGWIKFVGRDGNVSSNGNQSDTQKGSGATVQGYLNVNTEEIEFLINYNMMNLRTETFLQRIDKTRIYNYESELSQYEEDLKRYKEEHGLN